MTKRNGMIGCVWLSIPLLIALAANAPTLAQRADGLVRMYELTELTSPEGGESRAYAMNNTGQIVGWVTSEDRRHSCQWHNLETTDLHGTVHFVLQHPLYDQDYGESYDISNAGQVVGTARTTIKCAESTVTITNAFVLRPAVLTDLATPYPGDALTNLRTFGYLCIAYDSAATGISNANHVVGWADREDGSIHAFLVTPAGGNFFIDVEPPAVPPLDIPGDGVNDLMMDLGTLAASDPVSSASAVNDAGQVTGYSYTIRADGTAGYHAFLVTPLDVNDDGVPDTWFQGADGVNTLMADLGTLGGTNSWGRDINTAGEVVGESDYDHPAGAHYTQAFHWGSNQMTRLGTLRDDPSRGFSAASGVNNSGGVVGWAENEDRQRRAFVYEDGEMKDLNELLYLLDEDGFPVTARLVLTEARDINDDGVIVGWGTVGSSSNAETRGFLLNPVLVDPSVLEQAEEQQGSGSQDGNGDNGAVAAELIVGTPGNLGEPGAGDEGGDGATAAPLLCGNGFLGLLPLTVLGLGWVRVGARRSQNQKPKTKSPNQCRAG